MQGFLFEEATNKVFSIVGTEVLSTQYSTRELINHWSLSRWKYQYHSPDIAVHHKILHHQYPFPFDYERVASGVGCLGDAPLRYGDVEGDGQTELVVILNGLLVIFSPQYERIVFAEYIDESDWMSKAEMTQFFSGQTVTVAQYTSRFLAENDTHWPGVRAYAKLFLGDFDRDDNPDVMVWRKSYRSNAVDNPVSGFTKLSDVYQHFERDLTAQSSSEAGVTGEYLPQDTSETILQQWLATAEMSWATGYPSMSECVGQTNQLIPEMHDVLLNDPQVLP